MACWLWFIQCPPSTHLLDEASVADVADLDHCPLGIAICLAAGQEVDGALAALAQAHDVLHLGEVQLAALAGGLQSGEGANVTCAVKE